MTELPARLTRFRFPLMFVACLALLLWIYNLAPEAVVQDVLVHNATVRPSAALINWLSPASEVRAEGSRCVSHQARINVLRGCEGTEALLMLFAAVIAAWQRWTWFAVGLAGSMAVVFVLNQARIVTLYLVAVHEPAWLQAVHGYLAPVVIVGGAAVFFLVWLQIGSRRPAEA